MTQLTLHILKNVRSSRETSVISIMLIKILKSFRSLRTQQFLNPELNKKIKVAVVCYTSVISK